MSKLCVFAGTTEGRALVEFLAGQPVAVTACVATEYGETLLPAADNLTVSAKRMTREEMRTMMEREGFDLVVDGDLFKAIVTLPQGGPQPEQPETKLTLPEPAAPSAPAEGETPADPLGAFLNEIG